MATCVNCIHRELCNVHGYIDADECGVYKNKADFGNIGALEHFLKSEIYITTKRLNSGELNPFFNGVLVGNINSVLLLKNHILFCEHMLKLIDKEREAGIKNENN